MPTNHDNQGKDYPAPSGDFVDHPKSGPESTKLGYETTDVNVGGVIVFLGGLFGFVLIFFFFCFLMGRVINEALNKQDGPSDRWHQAGQIFGGAKETGGKRENLKSTTAMEQQELQRMTTAFPGPQLQTDDGNQATADLHAREDLLLDHYSTVPGQTGIRIPIDRAMQLVVTQGLPVNPSTQPKQLLAGDAAPVVSMPLTSGFARTGFELDTMQAREQKLAYGKAEAATHAELKPIR